MKKIESCFLCHNIVFIHRNLSAIGVDSTILKQLCGLEFAYMMLYSFLHVHRQKILFFDESYFFNCSEGLLRLKNVISFA